MLGRLGVYELRAGALASAATRVTIAAKRARDRRPAAARAPGRGLAQACGVPLEALDWASTTGSGAPAPSLGIEPEPPRPNNPAALYFLADAAPRPRTSLERNAHPPPCRALAGRRTVRGHQGRGGDRRAAHDRAADRRLAGRNMAAAFRRTPCLAAAECGGGRRKPARTAGDRWCAGAGRRTAVPDPGIHHRRPRRRAAVEPRPRPHPESDRAQLPQPAHGPRDTLLSSSAVALRRRLDRSRRRCRHLPG